GEGTAPHRRKGWEPTGAGGLCRVEPSGGGGGRRAGPAAARTRVGASVLEETGVVYRQTTVHHEGNARGFGPRAGRVVHDAELEPDQPRPQRDGVVHDSARVFAAPEYVHDVDRVVARGGRGA